MTALFNNAQALLERGWAVVSAPIAKGIQIVRNNKVLTGAAVALSVYAYRAIADCLNPAEVCTEATESYFFGLLSKTVVNCAIPETVCTKAIAYVDTAAKTLRTAADVAVSCAIFLEGVWIYRKATSAAARPAEGDVRPSVNESAVASPDGNEREAEEEKGLQPRPSMEGEVAQRKQELKNAIPAYIIPDNQQKDAFVDMLVNNNVVSFIQFILNPNYTPEHTDLDLVVTHKC